MHRPSDCWISLVPVAAAVIVAAGWAALEFVHRLWGG